VIGDDDVGAGPFEAEHGFEYDPLLVDPAVRRSCFDHAVFARYVIDRQWQVILVAQIAQDIKVWQAGFDLYDFGTPSNC